jgi:hypothetical protein
MESKQQLNNIHKEAIMIKLVKQVMSRQHVDFMNHGIIMIDVLIVTEMEVSLILILKTINYF